MNNYTPINALGKKVQFNGDLFLIVIAQAHSSPQKKKKHVQMKPIGFQLFLSLFLFLTNASFLAFS